MQDARPPQSLTLERYFNRLVRAQARKKWADELKEEVRHHMANAAQNIQYEMYRDKTLAPDMPAFGEASHRMIEDFAQKADELVKPLSNEMDMIKPPFPIALLRMRYAQLHIYPGVITEENFHLVNTFSNKAKGICRELLDLRIEGEHALFARSGLQSRALTADIK